MHSIEFLEINERRWIPENLGECDRRQYLDAAKLVLMYQQAEISLREFRVFLLYSLLNMTLEKSELENVEEEKWENIFIASEVLDSFFTLDENGKMHLVQDYTHNPVKVVKYLAHSFHGPKDDFSGFTYGQLEDGIGKIFDFHATGEIQFLVELFSIFYLKKGEKYSSINLEKRVTFFKYLDIRYVYGFYLLFISFFRYLTKECVILVDGRELDLRELFKESENTENGVQTSESLGMRSTSFQLAESGVFGSLNELREADGLTVLIRMYDLILRHRKEEADRKDAEEKAKNNSSNND